MDGGAKQYQNPDNATFVLEEVHIEDDDDEIKYEEVPDEDEPEEDDAFVHILNKLKGLQAGDIPESQADRPIVVPKKKQGRAEVQSKPAVVDDFIRNYLIKLGMSKTLDMFQNEWYELRNSGKLSDEDLQQVADVYVKNQNLDGQVKWLRQQVEKAQKVAETAKGTWDKFKRERDFHRMHHRRVVQEKNLLLTDLQRLKTHAKSVEPVVQTLQKKYEQTHKEKVLMKMERDKALQRLHSCEQQLHAIQFPGQVLTSPKTSGVEITSTGTGKKSAPAAVDSGYGSMYEGKDSKKKAAVPQRVETVKKANVADTPFPDVKTNPFASTILDPAPLSKMSLRKTFRAHKQAISSLALHPKKPIIATASDDMEWKVWSIPKGELIMSGNGHKDWISSVDFHPAGHMLATASGDATVKLWNLHKQKCVGKFEDHAQAVWAVQFHQEGQFLASASMDHTLKLWDLNSTRCVQSYRGHVDSVNAVCFQPFSTNLCSASGDKTVSLWDIRSGLCVQSFYGHTNAVISCAFNLRADSIVSSDADGVVKVWDIRNVSERLHIVAPDGDRIPVNCVKFDASGTQVMAGADNGSIRVHDITKNEMIQEHEGHEGSVQGFVIEPNGSWFVSGSADATFRLWQA